MFKLCSSSKMPWWSGGRKRMSGRGGQGEIILCAPKNQDLHALGVCQKCRILGPIPEAYWIRSRISTRSPVVHKGMKVRRPALFHIIGSEPAYLFAHGSFSCPVSVAWPTKVHTTRKTSTFNCYLLLAAILTAWEFETLPPFYKSSFKLVLHACEGKSLKGERTRLCVCTCVVLFFQLFIGQHFPDEFPDVRLTVLRRRQF